MNGDLISREGLLESLSKIHGSGGIYLWNPEDVLGVVEKAPAVEAEPVVHAHWEFVDFCSPNLECSACGGLAPMDCFGDYHSERSKRCPHCGAHMDEEAE